MRERNPATRERRWLQRGAARPVLLTLATVLVVVTIAAVVAVATLSPWWPRAALPAPAPVWLPAFIAPLQPPHCRRPACRTTRRCASPMSRCASSCRSRCPGQTLRLRLSNEYGELRCRSARERSAWRDGRSGAARSVPAAIAHCALPARRASNIAPGATVLSDPVACCRAAPAPISPSACTCRGRRRARAGIWWAAAAATARSPATMSTRSNFRWPESTAAFYFVGVGRSR